MQPKEQRRAACGTPVLFLLDRALGLNVQSSFFFLLFVGLLVCLLVAVFCHGLVVFVVLGATMGVVVCLVGVFW